MSTTNLGNVAIVPRGPWGSALTYTRNNLVSYDGNSYVATQDVPTGTLPTDVEYWMLSGQKGSDGDVTTSAMDAAIAYAVNTLDSDLQGQITSVVDAIEVIDGAITDHTNYISDLQSDLLAETTSIRSIEHGGTGQATIAAARSAFGLGNTTGALPIANGGTGQTTAAAARNAFGLGNTTGALPIANGGTGTTTVSGAKTNFGIQSGAESCTVPADSAVNVSVTFPTTYSVAPNVVATFYGSSYAGTGSISVWIPSGSITTTGFDARILSEQGVDRSGYLNWIAIG